MLVHYYHGAVLQRCSVGCTTTRGVCHSWPGWADLINVDPIIAYFSHESALLTSEFQKYQLRVRQAMEGGAAGLRVVLKSEEEYHLCKS